jgi:protein SCO1/2
MKDLILLLLFLFSIVGCEKKIEINSSAPQGGDFSIPSTHGEFSSKDYRGKVIFLFFGFAECPAICPKTLSNLSQMMKSLPESERKKVEVIFITVNPAIDTLSALKDHLTKFSPAFKGGNTNEKHLKEIMDKFGASFQKYPGAKPGSNTFSHTSDIFIINQAGHFVDKLKYDDSVQKLLAAFRGAAEKSPLYAKHRSNRLIKSKGENNLCDLSQQVCELEGFELSFFPRPLNPENTFKIELKKKGTSDLIPIEIDIQGVDLNMGYIRPQLTLQKETTFTGEFYLPACELSEMKWRARLILKTKEGDESLDFYFKTTSNQI